MKEEKNISLVQFYADLESVPDNRTMEEVRSDLEDLGINADEVLSRLEAAAKNHLKADRLAWKKDAVAKKSAFQKAKASFASWTSATVEEIEKAYADLLSHADTNVPSFAFRNKTNLSIQDKARLLDSLKILRTSKPGQTDNPRDPTGT
jgi:hypothetical protein